MRYRVQFYLTTGAPHWYVEETKTGEGIARCYTRDDAKKVATALNRLEADLQKGKS